MVVLRNGWRSLGLLFKTIWDLLGSLSGLRIDPKKADLLWRFFLLTVSWVSSSPLLLPNTVLRVCWSRNFPWELRKNSRKPNIMAYEVGTGHIAQAPRTRHQSPSNTRQSTQDSNDHINPSHKHSRNPIARGSEGSAGCAKR